MTFNIPLCFVADKEYIVLVSFLYFSKMTFSTCPVKCEPWSRSIWRGNSHRGQMCVYDTFATTSAVAPRHRSIQTSKYSYPSDWGSGSTTSFCKWVNGLVDLLSCPIMEPGRAVRKKPGVSQNSDNRF